MNCALCSKSSKGRLRRSTLDFLRESKNSKARMEDTSNGTARDVTMLQAASDCSDNCNDAGHLAGLCTWSCHEPHHVALLIMLNNVDNVGASAELSTFTRWAWFRDTLINQIPWTDKLHENDNSIISFFTIYHFLLLFNLFNVNTHQFLLMKKIQMC